MNLKTMATIDNGIIIDGKVYEAYEADFFDCVGCAFEGVCPSALCEPFEKELNTQNVKLRLHQQLTDKNNEKQ